MNISTRRQQKLCAGDSIADIAAQQVLSHVAWMRRASGGAVPAVVDPGLLR